MILAFILLLVPLFVTSDTEVRISNNSDVPIENVRVWFSQQTEDFASIAPKGVTDYRRVKETFCLTRIEAVVDGKPAIVQPFDHHGEKVLKPGKYTFVLSVNAKATSEFNRLRLKCRRD
jgi:hypothetical protein